MAVAVITGSSGLVGSEAARYFHEQGLEIAGVDNDMRRRFFGKESSTQWNRRLLERQLPGYRHHDFDVRDKAALEELFRSHGKAVTLVIHAAGQPSHDWAARDPGTDFSINALGTLNVLEAARRFCPDAVFIFTSTNKVYGDHPNRLPLRELETRWELEPGHPYAENGVDESMSIDGALHSVFGASKAAADLMVQEYGRYFGMKTVCFRASCLTGAAHSGAELHGFLSYLMRCAVTGTRYVVHGYKGKQVRDNLDSRDLAEAFHRFFLAPRSGEVYNMGGGRFSHCSLLEAVALCETISGRSVRRRLLEDPRLGDHIWWVSDTRKFEAHYPGWKPRRGIETILRDIHDENVSQARWTAASREPADVA